MKDEKFEVPQELDAKILQYAESKKFNTVRWYRTIYARTAAVILIGTIIGSVQLTGGRKAAASRLQTAEKFRQESFDLDEFEANIEYVANEIADEALYLAQL